MNKVKQFSNSINLAGVKYYSSSYLAKLNKSFQGAEFVKIGNQIFYKVSLK